MPAVGLPRDPAQWIALAVALIAIAIAGRLVRPAPRARLFVALSALAAAALSAAYVAVYLRGGPRIIDAASYFQEARAIARGHLSFPLPATETSVLGRFLVRSVHPDGAHATVIFPPGYPAVLAVGFLLGAPLAVGPALAALLAVATFDLARHLDRGEGPSVARIAAMFSVISAALRYHTADTMSHGLSALCFTGAIALAFRALDDASSRRAIALAAGAGLASGGLFATRPVSAIALAVTLSFVILRDRALTSRGRVLAAILAGAIPGAALFFFHQHAATGSWLTSSQRLYYAVSDGPADCFRYGFGAGIGCVGEHGDFVKARLAEGYGALAAAGTTLRRLKMHLVDPLNLEPLALLVPLGAFLGRGSLRTRALAIAVVAQILVYVPFYFDGNYPGGGGRFFCDVLPIEHALAALAVVTLAARTRAPARFVGLAIALPLAGFAFRAGFDHAELRDREGGRPLFLASDLGGVTRGLVFVDTDHGFALAFDPAPRGDLSFARFHGDALDRLLFQARGRPPAYRHHVVIPAGGGQAQVTLEPLTFPATTTLGIEGESLWPPLAQRGAHALPEWAAGTCASGDRWLALRAAPGSGAASFTVALPSAAIAGRALSPRIALGPGARGEARLLDGAIELARWPLEAPAGPSITCLDLPAAKVPEGAADLRLELARDAGASAAPILALDRLAWPAREND